MTVKIAVLASGRGSNLQALIDNVESGQIPGKIIVIITDNKNAYSLERAKKHGIEGIFINPDDFQTRSMFDMQVVSELKKREVDLVCLAGYMKIISKEFVDEFPNSIMNIHPALLPSFPGLHGQKDALDYGVKISGCTVHFVDAEIDHGPIILQASVPVLNDDDINALSKRILKSEHMIYPKAVKWFCEGKISVVGRKVSTPERPGIVL